MLEWTDTHIFSYSWKLMVEAAFRKYPNPYSSHVHSLDTIQRRVSGSKIYSHRLFCTLWNIPAVVLKIVGTYPLMQVIVKEQSVCDLEQKKLIIHAQNMSLSNLFTLKETLEYSISKIDPSETVLKQTASVDVHGIPLLGGALEKLWLTQYRSSIAKKRVLLKFLFDRYISRSKNAQKGKGRLGIQSVADEIFKEQCTELT